MVKAATVWLCLVALATVLNSVILFKYSRFIDFLIGLSFTQFIDAVFVGMHLEPPGGRSIESKPATRQETPKERQPPVPATNHRESELD